MLTRSNKKSSNVRNSSGNIIIVKLNSTQNKTKKMKQILVFLYMCNIKYIYSNKPTVRQRDRLISTCIRTFVNMQTIILFSISSAALVALIAFESDSVSKSSQSSQSSSTSSALTETKLQLSRSEKFSMFQNEVRRKRIFSKYQKKKNL